MTTISTQQSVLGSLKKTDQDLLSLLCEKINKRYSTNSSVERSKIVPSSYWIDFNVTYSFTSGEFKRMAHECGLNYHDLVAMHSPQSVRVYLSVSIR